MKKITILSILFLLGSCNQTKSNTLTIGIIQIVEHEALDNARKGFEDQIKKDYPNVIIKYKNAQGDFGTLNTIAASFASQKVDLIFAIATPSAQAAASATQSIPIIFTAVSDPVSAKLVDSLNNPNKNITGTTDAIEITKQFELLKNIKEVKKVGILYNTSEVNSQTQVNEAKSKASEFGYEIIEKGITSTNEISIGIESLLKEIDALYIPTDNMVVSSLPLIIPKALESKIIIIGSEEGQVKEGALATDGINYYNLGAQSAKMAKRVLENEDIKNIPVETTKESEIIINKTTQNKLKLTIKEEILAKAKIIE